MKIEFVVKKSQIEGKSTNSYLIIKLTGSLYVYYDGKAVFLVDKFAKSKVILGTKLKVKKSLFSDKVKIIIE